MTKKHQDEERKRRASQGRMALAHGRLFRTRWWVSGYEHDPSYHATEAEALASRDRTVGPGGDTGSHSPRAAEIERYERDAWMPVADSHRTSE